MNALKLRIAASAVFVCLGIFIAPASLLWAKPKKPTDQDICSGKQTVVYSNCVNNGGSDEYCWKASLRRYNQCMQARGHAAGTYPAMTLPSPTATPKSITSVHPIGGATTNKGPQSSPTATPQTNIAKPKPTPTPHKSHHP